MRVRLLLFFLFSPRIAVMEALPFDREVLARLPLAEAVLVALRHSTLPEHCHDLFARLKGRCYEHFLSFGTLVDITRDALLRFRGSGRKACAAAKDEGTLPTSHQAFYEKLAHLPLPLSEAFLAENSSRLAPLFPTDLPSPVPASLAGFQVQVLDGKVVKRLAKRLKVFRGKGGGLLGGKGLVSVNGHTGLVTAMASTTDGLVNDCALVPALVAQVRSLVDGIILWLGDCQFCDLNQTEAFTAGDHHFLVRYHPRTHFCPDPTRPAQEGRDERGRRFVQQWGWLGCASNARRREVRQVTLYRPGEKAVVVVTDLLDEVAYPAEDLLELYLQRWGIEKVFQKITEVFSLERVISTSPEGTVFQLGFCLLLYNLIQLVRGYVAAGQGLAAEAVSMEMVLDDVRQELTALHKVVDEQVVPQLVPAGQSAAQVRARLAVLLRGLWRPIWLKTTNKKRRAHQPKSKARGHVSVQRGFS